IPSHMIGYNDDTVFVFRVVLPEDMLYGFQYDLVLLIGGENNGELLEPFTPGLFVPPPGKGC
ncbi:MAG: hypothetical protein PHC95_08045, partial [Parabacteroides sp.]|nr:hypothetical protein [Parabacteroides sp.]